MAEGTGEVQSDGSSLAGQLVSIAPATGEQLGSAAVASPDAVVEAVTRARLAQRAWSRLPIEERCAAVRRFADALVAGAEALVELASAECGKPRQEVLVHEIMVMVDLAGFYAKRASKILAPREISLHLFRHRKSYVHYVPRGVVGIIAPAYYPIAIALSDALSAWIAGNAVVLKPSEHTPLVALRLKEIFGQAGLPGELFQVAIGGPDVGRALIAAEPDLLSFTGTTAVGRRVAALCGERLIPCRLGLSGKAAAVVCEDAELERAARGIVFGGFASSGQLCLRVERVYAHAAIYDELVQRITALASALKQGDPARDVVDLGAMTSVPRARFAKALVDEAVERGARLMCGGGLRQEPGLFFEPTVLAECDHGMRIMREETFAPVVPIMRVNDDEEAMALANDSEFGLMGYVFTRDKPRGRDLAERMHAGTVMLNDVLTAYACPEAPIGGIRRSGYGRVHGDEGLREMCDLRHVNVNRVRTLKREPVWFPYRRAGYGMMLRIMRAFMRSGSPVKRVIDLL